jgi:hypothetical protein
VTGVAGLRKCEGIDGPERSRGWEDTYVNVTGGCAEFFGKGLCGFYLMSKLCTYDDWGTHTWFFPTE